MPKKCQCGICGKELETRREYMAEVRLNLNEGSQKIKVCAECYEKVKKMNAALAVHPKLK